MNFYDVILRMRNEEPMDDILDSVEDITGMAADSEKLAKFMGFYSVEVYKYFFKEYSISPTDIFKALQISMVLGYLFGANSAEAHHKEIDGEWLAALKTLLKKEEEEKFSLKEYEEATRLLITLLKSMDNHRNPITGLSYDN